MNNIINYLSNFILVVLAFLRRFPYLVKFLNIGHIKQFIDETLWECCLPE
ncbi:hypothetical protein KM1_270350 [Entamoeba histolytica HM-3:IMSS]|uniref:Uncharacterized protein n=1 Tax=Entamoeba histolytica HM-3:IMSS TaxID=885315 RepID=M7VTV2_ENTHI|nr:hypothetical protein KM1_270350 [Entamoeba histolytica HM-3:IMSS]